MMSVAAMGAPHTHRLTDRQRLALMFIHEEIAHRGYAPTMREIGARMGIRSTNGVNDHLSALERKGYIERDELKSRAIRLTAHGLAALGRDRAPEPAPSAPGATLIVPVFARITGAPSTHGGGLPTGTALLDLPFDRRMLGPSAQAGCFGLRVSGDAMIEDGILSGDIVFAQPQRAAARRDIVVAMIADEACVRVFNTEGQLVRLSPANKRMTPVYMRASDYRPSMILGVVIAVYRGAPRAPDEES